MTLDAAARQLQDLRRLSRKMKRRRPWLLKWATSRRVWRNLPQEREYLVVRREALDNALQAARNPQLYRSAIDWTAIEHTFHPRNQYREPK